MDALRASYGDTSSDSESDADPTPPPPASSSNRQSSNHLPPPPLDLLNPPNSLGALDYLQSSQPSRVRSFPHVEGNYALHVYIPVRIPPAPKKELAQILKKVSSLVPGLNAIDVDIPLNVLCSEDLKLEQVALGREFHISLGRTVPIRVHQIDSVVAMLRQKLQFQKRYLIDFSKLEVFVNDDRTRSFLSVEVLREGLAEITKQIQAVNEVYKLHNLPEFYKDPRPHISIAWALGDISDLLTRVVKEEAKRCTAVGGYAQKHICTCKFSGIDCKIGDKTYKICKFQED
ncbi:U6 snRNA phosphodiesterase [Actinidia chinensis var. chinensis]|uniref:U6 snRNA phosphodiesterase n=1 Tax=Actinidia chinensis var. chinensis TaxID=1590841 RepID=A0A2R6PLU1_ACTCC|nr:U6 snRNA phosphodiesterase [Actinidia chinensis var. chinensis]